MRRREMIELFQLHFFRNAFIMSIIVGILFGILSFFIVMRKMSFLGAGIAHTAFGGVALGVLLGIDPFFTSLAFCIASAVLIGKLVRFGRISFDMGIGIFFSFSMALGAIFLSLKKGYAFDLMSYLFGNILAVTPADNIIALATLAVFIPFIFIFIHRILFMTMDEEVAAVSGVRTELLDTILLIFLAGIIVISIKIVGIILISALVVLPASFGLLVSKNYRKVILYGIVFTVVVMIGGLFLSYYLDTPAGATMVTAGTILYFLSLGMAKIVTPDR
jgi:zinc transport system permease protein